MKTEELEEMRTIANRYEGIVYKSANKYLLDKENISLENLKDKIIEKLLDYENTTEKYDFILVRIFNNGGIRIEYQTYNYIDSYSISQRFQYKFPLIPSRKVFEVLFVNFWNGLFEWIRNYHPSVYPLILS
jgi:hypothetical protein